MDYPILIYFPFYHIFSKLHMLFLFYLCYDFSPTICYKFRLASIFRQKNVFYGIPWSYICFRLNHLFCHNITISLWIWSLFVDFLQLDILGSRDQWTSVINSKRSNHLKWGQTWKICSKEEVIILPSDLRTVPFTKRRRRFWSSKISAVNSFVRKKKYFLPKIAPFNILHCVSL